MSNETLAHPPPEGLVGSEVQITQRALRVVQAFSTTVGPLSQLMQAQALHCVFQPIADLREGSIFGHEALIRGPVGTRYHSPDALLAMASSEDKLAEFELFCVETALRQWGAMQRPGRLFVNLSASALVQALSDAEGPRTRPSLERMIDRMGVSPRMLVVEITEHERVIDMPRLREAVKRVHAAGALLALDDFGDGRSSLRVWSEVKPDFVKIDKYFTRDISGHTENLQIVQAIRSIADIFGTQLIAEGIEERDDLLLLRDLEITYGQGYLLGRPHATVRATIELAALTVLQDRQVAIMPQVQRSARPRILRNLSVIHAPTVTPVTSNDDLAQVFQKRPDLHAVAVLDDDRPVALVNRQQFMTNYAMLYFREVHGRKSCIGQANSAPRLVELDDDVEELIAILTSQDQRYLSDGFIVTENGRYAGLGTGDQLVRSVTEARIEAARHANPLTFLPGNIPISLHMQRLLDNSSAFVACYADLNHFKPFNDHYGYWRGDEIIRLVARLALANCDTRRDFVGHVGGDDFLILFQSHDWRERCERLIESFATEAFALFDEPARQAGGIEAEDRHGVMRFFPCTTLSIGAVCIEPGALMQAEEVANAAALAKHDAKMAGAGLVVRPAIGPAGVSTPSPCPQNRTSGT